MPDAQNDALRVGKWWGRIDASQKACDEQMVFWDKLEDALAGYFPGLIPSAAKDPEGVFRMRHADQVDLNLLLRAKRIFESTAYDEAPTLGFDREPKTDEEAVIAAEDLVVRIMDEGDAIHECRTAMGSSMTRGLNVVWIDVQRARATPIELAAQRIDPASYVEQAMALKPPNIPLGSDYEAVLEDLAAPLNTGETELGLPPEQQASLMAWLKAAQDLFDQQQNERHSLERRAKIKYEATPVGTWFLPDMSVTDRRRWGWIARKMVMTPDEVAQEELFKPEVRKLIVEQYAERMKSSDGQVPGKSQSSGKRPMIDEQDRITFWEIHDKVNWKRHYLCSLVKDQFCEVDDAHPCINEHGQPIFPDFWPCVIRAPLEHNKEVAWRTLGIPILEPGWPHQIEFIKARSAWIIACKKSGRYFTAANSADDAALTLLARGVDGTWVKPGANYNAQIEGDLVKPIPFGPAPVDYLISSKQCLADFANAIGISLAAMTGEPVADTLGQEQIAMSGSNITTMDMVRCYESAYAELGLKTFLLFRSSANDGEMISYLGQDSATSRGNKPSIIDAIKNLGLDGCRMVARFASSTRAEDAVAIKQAQDFLAQNQLILEPLSQQPHFDPRPLLERIAKMQDIQGLVPNPAILAVIQMQQAQMQMQAAMGPGTGEPKGGDRQSPGGGREDGRKAGGGRGPPPVPGRQGRDRQPATSGQMAGIAARPASATS